MMTHVVVAFQPNSKVREEDAAKEGSINSRN